MKSSDKTKEQLLIKINELQTKIVELEKTKDDQKEIKDELLLKNTVFESSIAANSISDINGNIIKANPAFINIWGYDSIEEVIGKPILHFLKNKDEALKIVTTLNEIGKWEGVYEGLKKDGSTFTAYGLATTVQDEKGNNIGYQSAVIDVSEQRKAKIAMDQAIQQLIVTEQQLRAANQQLEANNQQMIASEQEITKEKNFSEKIVETASAIIIGLDKDHIIRIFNKGAESITGYTKAEVIGKDWFELFFPNEMLDEMNKVWKKAWGINSHSNINPILSKAGKKIIVSWQTTGMYEGEDVSKHLLLSIGEDITERTQAEERLEAEFTRFQTTMNAIDAGVYVADMQTYELIFSNKAFNNLFGEKIGEKCYSVVQAGQIKPCDYCTNHLLLDKKGNPKEPHIWEFKNTITKKWYQLSDQAITWSDGRIVRLEIATDITERKQAEEALKESEKDYHKLFDDSPVALLKDDMSELFSYFAELKEKGVKDFRKYFTEHPTELQVCTTKIIILNINKQYIKLHKAKNKKELMSNIFNTFTDISQNIFKEKMIAIASGKIEFESESEIKTLTNEVKKIYVKVKVKKIEINNINYTHGLLALFDITERKQTEKDLVKRNEELELFNRMAVGRELKMIDLKKEVNDLLEKAGKEPAYKIVE